MFRGCVAVDFACSGDWGGGCVCIPEPQKAATKPPGVMMPDMIIYVDSEIHSQDDLVARIAITVEIGKRSRHMVEIVGPNA